MKFNQLMLNENIKRALQENNFFDTTEVQEKTIQPILEGKDLIVRSQTGSGKTLAYALPIVQNSIPNQKQPQSIVICPTRELALQICDEIRKVTKHLEGIKIVPIYGGSDITRQIYALKKGVAVVVGTPGRIIDHLNRKSLKLQNIKTVVLDEADEMLNMGFKEDIESILKNAPSKRQTLMFSATYPPKIKELAKVYLSSPINIEIGSSNKSIKQIKQQFAFVGKTQKQQALLKVLNTYSPKTAIIFCNTKRMCEEVGELLKSENFLSSTIHGDLRQSERKRVMQAIKSNSTNILVATDVAARGIDINDVDYVINFDIPNNVEYLLHRMGRTARAGKSGNVITIINTPAQLKLLNEYKNETSSETSEIDLGEEFKQRLSTLKNVDTKNNSSTRNEKFGFAKKDKTSFSKKGFSDKKIGGNKNYSDKKFDSKDKFSKDKFGKDKKSFSSDSVKRFDSKDKFGKDKNKFFDKDRKSNFSSDSFKKEDKNKKDFGSRQKRESSFKKNDEDKRTSFDSSRRTNKFGQKKDFSLGRKSKSFEAKTDFESDKNSKKFAGKPSERFSKEKSFNRKKDSYGNKKTSEKNDFKFSKKPSNDKKFSFKSNRKSKTSF